VRALGTRYVLHELLGQGTTGEVWRATRREDGSDVAVKMLRPEFADDQVVVDRFLREWQILYDIDSPELVRVLDLVNERDALAIVMELVDGPDLREYLRHEAPLPVADAVRVVTQVLWALDTVHGAGVVHRDVKPENVLLDERRGGRLAIRLTDFGIARLVDTLSRGRPSATGPIGTPLYMAPELGTGGQPTPAADIYSTGILLYELLAGMPPYDEAHPTDMLRAHLEQEPLPIKGVPRPVWDVLATMLEKSPQRRPPSASDAARALEDAAQRAGTGADARADGPRGDERHQERRGSDTWERVGVRADARGDADPTILGTRRMAAVGAAAVGVGASASASTGLSEGGTTDTRGQGGYGRDGYDDWDDQATRIGPAVGGGGRDDWDDDPRTNLIPPARRGGPSGGPRGGHGDWDDRATRIGPTAGGGRGDWDDQATRVGPAVGGGGRGDWDDQATRLGPAVGGGRRGDWDDQATRIGPTAGSGRGDWDDHDDPPTGGTAIGGGRRGWDDYDDPPTGGEPMRVPGRAGSTRSDRNTIISAIPAANQPSPGSSSGGRPPVRDNRQRLRVAAGAGLVVALVAVAGGWALAASGGGSNPSATATSSRGATGGPTAVYTDSAGNVINPTATAAYVTRMPNGAVVTVTPGAAKGASVQPPPPGQTKPPSSNAGAPTSSSPSPTSAAVPNVIGLSKANAESKITSIGFPSPTENSVCTSGTPIGEVASQSPTAGTKADLSTTITISISAPCATVPNVIGQAGDTAKATLNSAGFSAQTTWGTQWTCDYGYTAVTAESTSLGGGDSAAGTTQPKGTAIYIAYSCKDKPTPPPTTAKAT
jgi:serine/threonine-protein kinase